MVMFALVELIMTRIRNGLAGAAALAAAGILAGCSSDEAAQTSAPNATATADAAAAAGSEERPGSEDGNYVFAESVDEWLRIGKVAEAITGRVVGVDVGPAVTARDYGKQVGVVNTALLQVEVEESFLGTTSPGDVVPVALFAGSGTVIEPGDKVPTTPDKYGTSIGEFEAAFPAGARIVAMSNPHPITLFQGSSAHSVVYPDGLAKRDQYMHGVHPQALSVENPEWSMSGWETSYDSYDELVGALRTATG